MATFLARIHIHPGREAEFERIAAELHRQTHEREAGVRRYEYWRGAEPSTYYALASFDSFDAFLVHQSSDHHELATPSLRDVTASMHLEWLDPVPGCVRRRAERRRPVAGRCVGAGHHLPRPLRRRRGGRLVARSSLTSDPLPA